MDIVTRVGVSETRVHFAANQVAEDMGVQAKASGEGLGLARVQVQLDTEVAVSAAAQLAVVLVGALCGAGYLDVDIVCCARSVVGDAYMELALGLAAGIDVGHGHICAELTIVSAWFARSTRVSAAWLRALALEVFRIEVVAAIGIIETNLHFAANLVFIDIGVQVEARGEGLRLARAQVQGHPKLTLLAGAHLAIVDILAVEAAEDVGMHIVQRARSVVGDAHMELAVGLAAGIDIGHSHISAEGSGSYSRGNCRNRADREGQDC